MPVAINGNGTISGLVITTADLADSSVTTAKIADSAITTGKIADGAVATADIADSAVTTAKIANANVTVAKISATGTADSTTYLRGDGSWQVVSTTPTTAQVLTATAGASVGAVGTYIFRSAGNTTWTSNSTIAGSSIQAGLSGTWRALGASQSTGRDASICQTYYGGVYLRIS